MHFIVELLSEAGLLFILAALMPSISIKNYSSAIFVVFVIAILNATIGFLIRLPLNILTLGLLSFFVRLFVSAIMIKIADKIFKGFQVKGWTPAFIIAFAMALLGIVIDSLFH